VRPRFRLRLFAQEFDLRPGATRIGRSASCAITIDDPSISREHAELVVDEGSTRIRDLGSRNGVRVNGARIAADTTLHDGDRIGIGQQDLVFNADTRDRNLARTSRMVTCPKCDVPYAQSIEGCPLCRRRTHEALEATSEIEIHTPVQPTERTGWWLALHAELVDRALANGRIAEAEQAMQRVDEAFASAILSHHDYDPSDIEPVLAAAVRVATSKDRPRWLAWTLETLRAFHITPSNALVAQLEGVPVHLLDDARVALASYVAEMRDSSPSLEGLAAIAADLSSTRRLLASPATGEVPRAS
jgi:hypothetical protein